MPRDKKGRHPTDGPWTPSWSSAQGAAVCQESDKSWRHTQINELINDKLLQYVTSILLWLQQQLTSCHQGYHVYL